VRGNPCHGLLECKQIDEWLLSLGLWFEKPSPHLRDLGAYDADLFIEDALASGFDPFSPEGFQKQVTEFSRQPCPIVSKVAFARTKSAPYFS